MLRIILDTAPRLYDNINLFRVDGHLVGGVSLLPHETTNVLIKERNCNTSINHQIFEQENNILFPKILVENMRYFQTI
jgi:hypothetical protein